MALAAAARMQQFSSTIAAQQLHIFVQTAKISLLKREKALFLLPPSRTKINPVQKSSEATVAAFAATLLEI